jgi:hypothetical protein
MRFCLKDVELKYRKLFHDPILLSADSLNFALVYTDPIGEALLSDPNCKSTYPSSPDPKPGAPIAPETLAEINRKRAERQRLIEHRFLLDNQLDILTSWRDSSRERIRDLTNEIRRLSDPEDWGGTRSF